MLNIQTNEHVIIVVKVELDIILRIALLTVFTKSRPSSYTCVGRGQERPHSHKYLALHCIPKSVGLMLFS